MPLTGLVCDGWMVDRHSDREIITAASASKAFSPSCSRHPSADALARMGIKSYACHTHTRTHTLDWNTAAFQKIRAQQPLQKHVKSVTVKESGGLMRKQTERTVGKSDGEVVKCPLYFLVGLASLSLHSKAERRSERVRGEKKGG